MSLEELTKKERGGLDAYDYWRLTMSEDLSGGITRLGALGVPIGDDTLFPILAVNISWDKGDKEIRDLDLTLAPEVQYHFTDILGAKGAVGIYYDSKEKKFIVFGRYHM